MILLHVLYTRQYIFAGQLSLKEDALRSPAPYYALPGAHCVPTRLASYIVTAMTALYLALHHDQDLLYYRAEDSDVVEATLYGGAPHLISAIAPVHCAAQNR